MKYLIGIDVGTSSAKTILINEDGEVVFTIAPEYEFRTPRPLWAEADPEDWWAATVKAIKELLKKSKVKPADIAGLGLTGQMHGLVMLDKSGNVVRPCIMWNDQRTSKQCAELTEKVGRKKVLRLTGNPILPGFTAPKIAWVAENEPANFKKTAKILLPKDYIRYRLSGDYYTEVSDASGMSLLNVGKRKWSKEMIDACGIREDMLATVTESTEASTKISAEAARATGLLEGTPIIAGGGDQAAQAVGCGIIREGIVSCTLGTSGVVFAHSKEYRVEPEGRLHAFCAAVPNEWHLMGVMLSAAGSYQWYRNTLCLLEKAQEQNTGTDSYVLLERLAETAPPGSEGLLFLPYLSGERTPHPDPNAKGVYFGLTLRHSKAHMTRAVLEGVTYGLADSLNLMRDLGIAPKTVIASGGGAKSPLWRKLLADIFQTNISTVNATEGAAYGAAILAGVGSGVYASVPAAIKQTLKTQPQAKPGKDKKIYADFYGHYRNLYPLLKDEFATHAATVAKHYK